MRELLQESVSQDAAAPHSCSCESSGVNPNGWVALALFVGLLVGILGTMSVQCLLARHRAQLSLQLVPATRRRLPRQGSNESHGTPEDAEHKPLAHPPALPSHPIFSPLHASKSFRSPSGKLDRALVQAASLPATDLISKQDQRSDQRTEATTPMRSTRATTQPTSVTRSSPDSPSQPPHGGLPGGLLVPAAAAAKLASASMRQAPASHPLPACSEESTLTELPNPFLMPLPATGSNPFVKLAGNLPGTMHEQCQEQADQQQQQQQQHVPAVVASAYEASDLPNEWLALMADLDRRLMTRGEPTMGPRERAIAVRRLASATGTRGADFAMQSALEEVMLARRLR